VKLQVVKQRRNKRRKGNICKQVLHNEASIFFVKLIDDKASNKEREHV
jgi:hypothetical protein